jgi:putative transposase
MSEISKNLYNQALYTIRQEYKKTKKYLNYIELEKMMKTIKNLEGEINYYLLKTQTSQQILRKLDKDYRSFFKKLKNGDKKCKSPKYKKEVNELIFTNQNSKIKNNKIYLSKKLIIQIPEYKNKDFVKFQQIRIIPRYNHFEIEIIYNQEIKQSDVDRNKIASIDLGVNNLATIVSTETKPLIINGRILKSINQWYNKEKARLISIKDFQKIKIQTKRLNKLNERRNNKFRDSMHKISRFIVNFLIENRIGTIVVGLNKNWKNKSDLGHKNNQTFVQIPFNSLISKLRYKCELEGIEFIIHEESYTSKIDHLVFEEMKHQEKYLGKRIKRGLFRSSCKRLINADINGSIGIGRKVFGDSYVNRIINRGLLFNPLKINNNVFNIL